jgi:hypothetical protein
MRRAGRTASQDVGIALDLYGTVLRVGGNGSVWRGAAVMTSNRADGPVTKARRRGMGDLRQVLAAQSFGGGRRAGIAPCALLRLRRRRYHVPGALPQLVLRQAMGVDHQAAGHQQRVVADLAEQVLVFGQGRQHQGQARRA